MRRRAPRVVWLPPDRFNRLGVSGGATTGLQNGLAVFNVDVPGGPGGSATGLIPLVQDFQPDITLLTTGTLADYAQSAYRLRRVVGKIFVTCTQLESQGLPPQVQVTAGLIVLRINPDDPTGQPLVVNQNVYSTQMLQNWTDPWIWRRTWIIGNLPQAGATPGSPFFPESNANYGGGVMDGPHVDAKTARIVGPEERLFLVVTGTVFSGDEQLVTSVRVVADLRVLASMRTSQGNRRNASR